MDLAGVRLLIQEAKYEAARAALDRLHRARKIRRRDLAWAARLAMMAFSRDIAIRLLHPVVRGKRFRPSAREKVEYAMVLTSFGADAEAFELLQSIDLTAEPRAARPLALYHIGRWEWRKAVDALDRALASERLEGVNRLIARLLRASALVSDGSHRASAREEALAVAAEARKQRLPLLEIEALTIAAQAGGVFEECEKLARPLLEGLKGRLPHRRWEVVRALDELGRAGTNPARVREARRRLKEARRALERLESERGGSEALGVGRTLRWADYLEGALARDEALLRRVYFGSTAPEIRRVVREAPGGTEALEGGTHEWKLGPARGERVVLDLSGPIRHGTAGNDVALRALFADPYSRPGVAQLHERMFEGQYFNPVSSPKRVRQSLARLKAWLARRGIPLGWRWEKGLVRLMSDRPLDVRVAARPEAVVPLTERTRERRDALRLAMEGREFAAAEAARSLGISLSSATRLLREGMRSGSIERVGSRKGARYRFR